MAIGNWVTVSNFNNESRVYIPKGEKIMGMSKFAKDNIRLTKDAELVDKYFGDLDVNLTTLFWRTRVNELIKEAKRLEKEEDK